MLKKSFWLASFMTLFIKSAFAQDPYGALDTVYLVPSAIRVPTTGGKVKLQLWVKTDNGAGDSAIAFLGIPVKFVGSTCGSIVPILLDTVGEPQPADTFFRKGNNINETISGVGYEGVAPYPDKWNNFILDFNAFSRGNYLWGTFMFDVDSGEIPCMICLDTVYWSDVESTVTIATSGTDQYTPYWKGGCFNISCAVAGDATGDGQVRVGDLVFLINHLFKGAKAPNSICEGDATGNGSISPGDLVHMINYIFKQGPAPVVSGGCCASG